MKETLPSYEAMMPAVLKVLADGVAALYVRYSSGFASTTPSLRSSWLTPCSSGRQTTLRNRVGWAKTYLVKAGLIEQPKPGHLPYHRTG